MNTNHVRNALTLMFILTLSNLAATFGTQYQVHKLQEVVNQMVLAADHTATAADHTAAAASATLNKSKQ